MMNQIKEFPEDTKPWFSLVLNPSISPVFQELTTQFRRKNKHTWNRKQFDVKWNVPANHALLVPKWRPGWDESDWAWKKW